MALILGRERIERLCAFVDEQIKQAGCDHSLRFAKRWAAEESIDWNDLLDILEANGAFCDCEIVLNISDVEVLDPPPSRAPTRSANPWLLPPNFAYDSSAVFNRLIVSRKDAAKNIHSLDGELLVPAPLGAKPKGRVRKSVHFFIGCHSGKAAEVGVIEACEPLTAADFANKASSGGVEDLALFGEREAAFVLSKIAALNPGMTVATNVVERVGIASKHDELTVHRVILRR